MAKKQIFENALKVGEIGEDVFIDYMEELNNFIVDVRTVPEYQKQDIDFLVYTDDDILSFEIKTDEQFGLMRNKNYARFFIEDIQNVNINSDGWFRCCAADVICIYDNINCVMYFMLMQDLREYINTYYGRDNKRVDYIDSNSNSKGYGVYINKFYDWLRDNDRYNLIIERG